MVSVLQFCIDLGGAVAEPESHQFEGQSFAGAFNYAGPTFSTTIRRDCFRPDFLLLSQHLPDNGCMADSCRCRQSAGI